MRSLTNGFLFVALNIAFSRAQIPLYKSFVGKEFLDGFYFFDDVDPANGVVNYVDKSTAQSQGLISYNDTSFTMKADSQNQSSMGKGRDSVRLVSNDDFGDGVYIFDIGHAPVGCGTWPAAWTTTTKNWPYAGEIDVFEGANANSVSSINTMRTLGLIAENSMLAQSAASPSNATFSGLNAVSLHTAPNCPIKDRAAGAMTGTAGSLDCSGLSEGNIGCGVTIPGKSYGGSFNENGGGVYALYRNLYNASTIEAWFWPRDVSPPADVANTASSSVNPANWGTPTATFTFQQGGCGTQFNRHVIVLNIDFCGDYAGGASYTSAGCPGICEAFVKYNPGAFTEAFFEFKSVRVYGTSAAFASISKPQLSLLSVTIILLGMLLSALV